VDGEMKDTRISCTVILAFKSNVKKLDGTSTNTPLRRLLGTITPLQGFSKRRR
jgi:hypothetical protein